MVRKISKGDSFLSLLSLLEHLQSKDLRFRTISVRAFTDCSIACYPLHKFRDWYIKNPRPWVRPIQIVMTRLLHVTLTTLHEYLGLSVELLRRRADEKRMLTDDRHRYIPAALNVMKSHSKIKSRRRHPSSSDESNEQQTVAAKMFADALGLGTSPESIELIQTRIDIVTIAENIIFIEENSEEEKLYLVVNGCAEIFQTHPLEDDQGEDDLKVLVHPRELIGGLQLLTSEPAFYSSRSYTQVTLAVMDKQSFSELLDRRPEIILPVALSVTHRLSSFVTTVDFAIDWVLLESGQAVYRIGDEADSIFTVLSGRLRSVDNKVVIEEFGRGDMLGMIEVLQGTPRKTTVLATRFSQLARIPEGLLNFVKMQFPQVSFYIYQVLTATCKLLFIYCP
ncbi:hypothetical protein AB6A40_009742 [Gnathostoma spinigerum]|uniref:Cyclic nucleotide-binding domain-containing protein n=1 Tax=Gnathostoma spinigerum TaxID=75299 RepID=A0ABD6ESU4_9BILA